MGLSWTDDSVNVHALWKALEMKTRLAEKFTDVSGVKVTDEDGFCPAAFHQDIGAPFHKEPS